MNIEVTKVNIECHFITFGINKLLNYGISFLVYSRDLLDLQTNLFTLQYLILLLYLSILLHYVIEPVQVIFFLLRLSLALLLLLHWCLHLLFAYLLLTNTAVLLFYFDGFLEDKT